jgi:hypothetical protein
MDKSVTYLILTKKNNFRKPSALKPSYLVWTMLGCDHRFRKTIQSVIYMYSIKMHRIRRLPKIKSLAILLPALISESFWHEGMPVRPRPTLSPATHTVAYLKPCTILDGHNRGRLWHEIYPHLKLFPDLILIYTGVQREF